MRGPFSNAFAAVAFALALGAAGSVPMLSRPALVAAVGEPEWPASIDGRTVRELPLSEAESRFAAEFPGRIKRLTDGRRIFILRWVTRPTRKLHPAADCFRGLGYAITPVGIVTGSDGGEWGGFVASRGDATLHFQERIWDAVGNSWTDVSSWFWAAALGRTAGPWWARTDVR